MKKLQVQMVAMSLYKNKYRIESARLPGWDYSSPGFYFVTICTHNREHIFDKIENGAMILNNYGTIVDDEWKRTFEIRPSLEPDEYVVMPNHFHCIVHIMGRGNNVHGRCIDVDTDYNGNTTNVRDGGAAHPVEMNIIPRDTQPQLRKNQQPQNAKSQSTSWKSGVLGAIIGQFKIKVTKGIRNNGYPGFGWQFRFHDHIIRNDLELHRIREYIRNNQSNWQKDKFNG